MGGQGHSCKTDFDWLQARTNMQKKEEQHEDARVRVPLSIAKKVDKLFSRVGANRKKSFGLRVEHHQKERPPQTVDRCYALLSRFYAFVRLFKTTPPDRSWIRFRLFLSGVFGRY